MRHFITPTSPKDDRKRIAVIGSGASALYLLKNLLERVDVLGPTIETLVVFERGDRAGMGMPYHPATTDRYNLCNISSEELPHLQESLVDWLKAQGDASLARFGLTRHEITETETYARLALGEYFEAQFNAIVRDLRQAGVDVRVRLNVDVRDLVDRADADTVDVVTPEGVEAFGRVVIASGHAFDARDVPEHGCYASPWPIRKLLPARGQFHDHAVGTLGASLSAFDVVTSLAHRHGTFDRVEGRLRFTPAAGAANFRIVMHSSKGWLPHLQYEQCRPFREVYRYVDRASLLAMRDAEGFLRLQDYFDQVCRPALSEAFARDNRADMATRLLDRAFPLEAFVEQMSAEHEYDDAFEGMKREFADARRSIDAERPVHWKETLDDLMYTLSYHADLMPAEDHQRFRKTVLSFLMNVIAAMPLSSAEILLALHEAGRLSLQSGRARVAKTDGAETLVTVTDEDDGESEHRYRLFVDCSGQSATPLERFPFQSLVRQGSVRAARAHFANDDAATADEFDANDLLDTPDGKAQRLDGIDIDAAYRVIGADGESNDRLFDIAFPHTTGLRPYSYGLQACNHTAGVVIEAWRVEAEADQPPAAETATLTRLHDRVANEP